MFKYLRTQLLASIIAALILMLLSPALLLFASAQSITAVGIWLLFGIAPFALLHSFLVQNAINPQKSDSI
jgi:hypothetical protein